MSDTTVGSSVEELPHLRSDAEKITSYYNWGIILLSAAAWFATAYITETWPEKGPQGGGWDRTSELVLILSGVGGVALLAALAGIWSESVYTRIRYAAPWLIVTAAIILAWELVTAKFNLLPMPFFPPPQEIIEVVHEDWSRLADSTFASFKLLAIGYFLGALMGFLYGVAIGWSKVVAYWSHPVLRFLGPLPATAWLPIAFFAFPSSWSAATFLVALATGFPVAVLTWSGVAGVGSAYYDIARTLGANKRFLILKVAIPAALPHVFVGLFMGLGASFSVIVVAEMLGVKSGLGWYLQWAQGWAAYANMYTALFVMAISCSWLITVLFRVRDRVLAWQKGLVRW